MGLDGGDKKNAYKIFVGLLQTARPKTNSHHNTSVRTYREQLAVLACSQLKELAQRIRITHEP